MKTLLVDAGNSYLKWATLDGDALSSQQSIPYEKEAPIDRLRELIGHNREGCDALIMVSVLGDDFCEKSQKIADAKGLKLVIVKSQSQLVGIKSAYKEPRKLGSDRLVAMVAAHQLTIMNSGKPQAFIVIDTGTATTIDAVDESGQHLGGVIMPGLSLCSESLLDNTEQLSLWNNEDTKFIPDCFSKETSSAIASGCLLGLAGGIDSICDKMEKEINKNSGANIVQVKKIICGGAASALLPHMQSTVLWQENLIMLGLKAIKEDAINNV